MDLDNIGISKVPSDVRKEFLQLRVMHAESKINGHAQQDFM